jgi:hypothetical protein
MELVKVDATYVSSDGRRKHTCTEQMPAANGGLVATDGDDGHDVNPASCPCTSMILRA